MKHEHKECEHRHLKYCKKCDVVYCEDCDKEWSSFSGFTPWTYPYTWTYTDIDTNKFYCSTHKI